MSRRQIVSIDFTYLDQCHTVKGRFAQTLGALVNAGPRGVTALEMQSWALRLGHYVWVLRHRYGLPIATETEPHDGGNHARYKLNTEGLTILDVQYREFERIAA